MNMYEELKEKVSILYDSIVELSFFRYAQDDRNGLYKYEDKLKDFYLMVYNLSDELNKYLNFGDISNNKENFDKRLEYYTGLTKQDIIEGLIFDLYANEVYMTSKKDKPNYVDSSILFEKYHKDDVIFEKKEKDEEANKQKRDKKKDIKKHNLQPYWDRYSKLFTSEIDKNFECEFLWKKTTHYCNLVGYMYDGDNETSEKYKFPHFQLPLYYLIASNYSGEMSLNYYFNGGNRYADGTNMLTYFFNEEFDKVKLENKKLSASYSKFIKEAVCICDKNEKYRNISYYIIEREFNPLLINQLLEVQNELRKKCYDKYNVFFEEGKMKVKSNDKKSVKVIADYISREECFIENFIGNTLYFLATINPFVFTNEKVIKTLANFLKKEDMNNLESAKLIIQRIINNFYPLLYRLSFNLFRDEIKTILINNENLFLSVYKNKGEEIDYAIENIKREYKSNFNNIICCKCAAHNTIRVINEKSKEIKKAKKISREIYFNFQNQKSINENDIYNILSKFNFYN